MMWSTPLDKFADLVIQDTNEIVKNAATDMVNGLADKAPVDTSRFLSNLNVSLNSEDTSYDEHKKVGRGAARANGLRVLSGIKGNQLYSVFLTDMTPYGVYLEAGYSSQAVNGVFYPVFMGVSMWYR
ncbi:hypothetical protein [Psychrobacter sanguinis]|uniref:hypothetical protein n=1 Tax=Psychrobacter sanguinis TaxID=861445 RepID=UPI00191A1DB2|nr:hypothetical protein [Psychrobacter sanguinis]MCC3344861.1 hypothetical protein [Psychrobacter sanguinis]